MDFLKKSLLAIIVLFLYHYQNTSAAADNTINLPEEITWEKYYDANEQQKNRLVTVIVKMLKEGKAIDDISSIYGTSNVKQRNILFPVIIENLKQGKEIKYLYLIYINSNDQQKAMLFPIIVQCLKQEKEIDDIAHIYSRSTMQQRSTLVPIIEGFLKEGKKIYYLDWIYNESNEEQKDNLIMAIAEYFNSHINFGDDFQRIYQSSNNRQKNMLVNSLVEIMKQDEEIGDIAASLYKMCNEQQKTSLATMIAESLKQGKEIKRLYSLFEDSNNEQKNILVGGIAVALSQGKKINIGLGWLYENSNDHQRNILLPIVVEYLKQGKEVDIHYIYQYSNTSQRNILFPIIIDNFKQGKEIWIGLDLVYEKSDAQQRDILFSAIVESLKQGKEIKYLDAIYSYLNTEQKEIIFPVIVDHLKQGKKINDIAAIYKASNDKQKSILVNALIGHMNLGPYQSTQTGGHILCHIAMIYAKYNQELNFNKGFKNILGDIIKNEYQLIQKGYYIFYHAQQWYIYWLELLYAKLWQLKYKKMLNHYIFTRFANVNDEYENARNIANGKEIRKRLMERGGRFGRDLRLLFLNYALFGNSTNTGSSSVYYFLNNANVRGVGIYMENIFEKFNLQDVYINNKKVFDELEKEFFTLSSHGNLLQIAMPKKHLQKHLYLAFPGGSKGNAQLKRDDNSISETNDIPTLIEALKQDPSKIVDSDQKEFVWVITEDTIQKALHDGVEIRSFNTADPEKFAHVMQKLDALLEKVVQEDQRSTQPKFKSQATPWECYKQHKHEIAQQKSK